MTRVRVCCPLCICSCQFGHASRFAGQLRFSSSVKNKKKAKFQLNVLVAHCICRRDPRTHCYLSLLLPMSIAKDGKKRCGHSRSLAVSSMICRSINMSICSLSGLLMFSDQNIFKALQLIEETFLVAGERRHPYASQALRS
jgi:hypothetical protein